MSYIFLTILNMSITASIVALTVMLVRIPLKKAPRIFSYALWGVVLFRLVCPMSVESRLSFMPAPTFVIPQDIVYSQTPAIQAGMKIVDAPINEAINNALPPVGSEINGANSNISISSESSAPVGQENNTTLAPKDAEHASPMSGMNPIHAFFNIAAYVWLFGFAALLIYAVIGYIRLKRRVYFATLVRDSIYETDKIETPFVLGFIRPKIYVPTGIDPKQQCHILTHEYTHIKRRDYLIKPFAFIVFALHWFNPIMWAAYMLMSNDMEMSCDEAVLSKTSEDIRGVYSESLLNLSVGKFGLLTTLAFGKSNVKSRVRNVLKFKKPSRGIVIAVAVLVAVLSAGFAVDRTSNSSDALDWTDYELPLDDDGENPEDHAEFYDVQPPQESDSVQYYIEINNMRLQHGDGNMLYVADDEIYLLPDVLSEVRVWHVATAEQVRLYTGPSRYVEFYTVEGIAEDQDGNILAWPAVLSIDDVFYIPLREVCDFFGLTVVETSSR